MTNEFKKYIKHIARLCKDDDFESALTYCDELINQFPSAWVFYREKADILESLKRNDEAIITRETLFSIGSDEPGDCYDLCRLTLIEGRFTESIQWADEAIKLCRHHDNFYYHDACVFYKANALLNLKRHQEAYAVCNLLTDGYGTYISGWGMKTKEDILREAASNT